MTNPFAASVQTWGLIIQTVVLTVTAGLVWWYASETQQMKKEMVHQTELQLRPFVKPVFYKDKNTQKVCIRLKNIGSGVACNIMIDPLVTGNIDGQEWRYVFDPVTALGAEEEAEVMYDHYLDQKMIPYGPTEYSDPFSQERELAIKFENAEGGSYRLSAAVRTIEKPNGERQVQLGRIEKR